MIYINRILAISDIHGCCDELYMLLNKVKYNEREDQLVLLGDYVDRGLKSKDVLDKVIELNQKGAIVLRGNHDQMFLDWLSTNNEDLESLFLHNGGFSTIESYVGRNWFDQAVDRDAIKQRLDESKEFIKNTYSNHLEFLESTKFYYEIDKYVFVHAGINPTFNDWKQTHPNDFLWIRKEFLNYPNKHTNRVFLHGHTPNRILNNKDDIYYHDNKIGLDGGCCFNGQLNCLEIKNGEYKEYHVLKS